MLKRLFTNPSIGAIVLTIFVALYAAGQGFVEVNLQGLQGADIGTLFLTLIFTALVIERAVEVYISNRYDPEEMKIRRGILAAQQRAKLLDEALAVEAARSLPAGGDAKELAAAVADKKAAVTRLRKDIADAREKVLSAKVEVLDEQIDIGTRKASAAGAVATVLGVIAAAAGVRVLGQFLPVNEAGEIIGPLSKTCVDATVVSAISTATGDLEKTLMDACAAVEWQLTAFRFADVLLTALLLAGGADGIHQLVKDFLSKRNDLKPAG